MEQVETKVDVLAVLDELVCTDLAALTHEQAQDFWAARAAIAELIEASSSYLELPTIEAADRLSAALSNVGGGK